MKRLMLFVVLAACGGGSATQTHEMPKPEPLTGSGDPSCPLEVPGTSVTVEDTANGAALVFVTTSDAAKVRTRAQAFATMHNAHNGPESAMGMMFPAEWHAEAKDAEGGARVELSAAKPEDAGKLQSELRMHAGHFTSGTCEM